MQAESAAVSLKKVQPNGNYTDAERIGTDGLPHAGTVLYPGQGYYSIVEPISGTWTLYSEEAFTMMRRLLIRDA